MIFPALSPPRPRRALLAFLVLALAAATVASLRLVRIRETSMVPTLRPGDLVLCEVLAPRRHRLAADQIVVLRSPPDPARLLVKRIAGLPGSVLALRRTRLFRDGLEVPEPWASYPEGGIQDLPPFEVPPGHLVVMGDARDESRDSRHFGAVPEETVTARAFLRIWPPSRIGWVP